MTLPCAPNKCFMAARFACQVVQPVSLGCTTAIRGSPAVDVALAIPDLCLTRAPAGLQLNRPLSALTCIRMHSQFPGSKEEEGLQREPEGAKQAREEGRTPAVDTPEEAAAPAHEYEFQPQVGTWSCLVRSLCTVMIGAMDVGHGVATAAARAIPPPPPPQQQPASWFRGQGWIRVKPG